MTVVWGDWSSSRSVQITPADVQVSSITAPVADSIHSTSVTVTYALTSCQAPGDPELVFYVEFDKEGYGIDAETWVLADIQVEYSQDGGSSYSVCTEDTVSFSGISEGTENLLTSASGVVHNYVWAMLTDMGTNDYLTNAYIRIKAYDGASWSAYLTSSAFTVDTVPVAPTYNDDSYSDGCKLKDLTPDYHFTIPTDVGSDRLHFRIDWDTSENFNTSNIVHRNSYDNDGFWHYHNNVDPIGSYTINDYKKYGDWYFKIDNVLTGHTYSFGDYKDYYKDIYLPEEFIDPKVIIQPATDTLFYLSGVTSTGFQIMETSDSDFPGHRDSSNDAFVYVFEGAWAEYWVSNIEVAGSTQAITFGSGDFEYDDNQVSIPANISTGTTIMIQPTSDNVFWITNRTKTGFTINKASDMGGSGTELMMFLGKTTGTTNFIASQDRSLVDGLMHVALDTTDSLGETIPAYIPGMQFLACPLAKTMSVYYSNYNYFYGSDGGTGETRFWVTEHPNSDANGTHAISLFGCNADYFWVPVRSNGIPEEYENEKAKFQVQTADAYSSGNTYYYRIGAGNV